METCYRHPDRETGVSCQRCDRYICTDCATPGAIGFLCPEDAKDKVKVHRPNYMKSGFQAAPITYSIIALNLIVYIAQWMIPGLLEQFAFYSAYGTEYGNWIHVLTSGFTHSESQITHIIFNMYSLYIFGSFVEPRFSKLAYLIIYFTSMFGAAAAMLFFAEYGTSSIGASGAIFGVIGATLVLGVLDKTNINGLLILLGINLVLGFLPGVAWQAHVGGFVAGSIFAVMLHWYKATKKSTTQIVIAGLIGTLIGFLTSWFY